MTNIAKYKKRPDGRYATRFIVGYDTEGKPKRRTLYGRTIAELDKKPLISKVCRIKVL